MTFILNRLELNDSLQIAGIKDKEGYTVINRAVFENSTIISEFLIKYYKERLFKKLYHEKSVQDPDVESD